VIALRPWACLLLPVSWLFVALIPVLLMLATFGLQRLETKLDRGCVGAAEVAEFLAQARPGDMRTLARNGMPEALDSFQRRRPVAPSQRVAQYSPAYALPVHAMANPQFRPQRRVDSV
jgi:hypothetical protein